MTIDTLDSVERAEKQNPAIPFETMALTIRHNEGASFGGAIVIVPPDGAGHPIEILVLDSTITPGDFYAMLTSRIQGVVSELDAKARQQNPHWR
ncbi:MAG TPA: hypothetical protein VLJ17_24525 [Xanthobacteraceae bacterium]|nr:hypothetical protein [Xanthobacteraceae bacterium]